MFLTNEKSVLTVGSSGWNVLRYQLGPYQLIYPAQVHYSSGTPKWRGGSHLIGPVIGKPMEGGPFVGLPSHGHWRHSFMMTEQADRHTIMGYLGGSQKSPFYSEYPYKYGLGLWTSVLPNGFAQRVTFQNLTDGRIPLQIGFHPYFWVRGTEVEIKSGSNNLLRIAPPFPEAKVYGHADQVVLIWQYAGKQIAATLTASGILQGPPSGWVVWSDNPEYLCVEPFSHTDRTLFREIGPGETVTGELNVTFSIR